MQVKQIPPVLGLQQIFSVLTGGPKLFQEVFQWSEAVSRVILLAPLPGSHRGQVQILNQSNTKKSVCSPSHSNLAHEGHRRPPLDSQQWCHMELRLAGSPQPTPASQLHWCKAAGARQEVSCHPTQKVFFSSKSHYIYKPMNSY